MTTTSAMNAADQSKRRANLVLAGSMIIIGAQFGSYVTLSVYVLNLMEKLSASLTQVVSLFSVAALVGIFANFIVAALIDKVSIKAIMAAGTICFGAFFAIFAFAPSLILVYFGAALFGLATNLAGFPAIQTAVSWWHATNVGKKLSLLSICMSLVGVALGFVLPRLLESMGFTPTVLAQGGAFTALMLIASLFMMSDKPEKYGLRAYGAADEPQDAQGAAEPTSTGLTIAAVFRTGQFWGVMLIAVLVMCFTGYTNNQAAIFQTMGTDAITAGTMLSVLNGTAIAWTFAFGFVVDKLGPTKATMIFMIASGVIFGAAAITMGFVGVVIFAVFTGVYNSVAGMWGAITLPTLFGLQNLGRLLPLNNVAQSVGTIIGPPLGGLIFEATGTYRWYFVLCVGLAAVITILYRFVSSKRSLASLQARAV